MSDNNRPSKKQTIFYVILGLATLGMIFIGVPSLRSRSSIQDIATVNGQSISQYAFNQTLNNLRANNADADTSKLRQAALDSLIIQTLLQQQALNSGYQFSDKALYQLIKNQFGSAEDYNNMLANNHITASAYQNSVRREETINNYYHFLQEAQITAPERVQLELALLLQNRDFNIITLPIAPFAELVNVTDKDLQNYFDAHKNDYLTPETTSIKYVLLDEEKLADPSAVTDEAIQSEQARRAADIKRDGNYLIFDKPEEAEKAAADLKDGSKTFAQLTAEVEKGTISGQAGKLDMHANGKGVSKIADDALFSLTNKGDISPLFDTEYGKMLIQLGDSSAPKTDNNAIRQALAQQAAEEAYSTLANNLFDAVQNGDSIDAIAQKAGTTVQTADNLTANTASPTWLQNPEVQKILFGEKATAIDKIAVPVQINSKRSIFIYIASREMPKEQTLSDVRAQVTKDYQAMTAKAQLETAAEKIVAAINKGEDASQLIKEAHGSSESFTGINFQKVRNENDQRLANAFTQTEKLQTNYLKNGDMTITELTAIHLAAEKGDDTLNRLVMQQIDTESNNIIGAELGKVLRKNANIKINEAMLNQAE